VTTHRSGPFMLRVMRFRPSRRSAGRRARGRNRPVRPSPAHVAPPPSSADGVQGDDRRAGGPQYLQRAGEPIVETPADAMWCFRTDMDYCVISDHVVSSSRRGFRA
jgi:hypothetical protein